MMTINKPQLSLHASLSCIVCDFVRYAHIFIFARVALLRTAVFTGLLAISCLDVCAGGIEVLLKPDVQNVWKVQFVTPELGVCVAIDGLYKTTNGGTSWRKCLELSNIEAIGTDCLDVSISRFGIGLHVSGSRMFQTLDAGSTWTELDGAQKPTLKESWAKFFRVYSSESGHQQVITNSKLIASRFGTSGAWVYDTVPISRLPRDVSFFNDTSALILNVASEVEYYTGPNRLRTLPNSPKGYRISANGSLVTIADIDKVWISRDGCGTWSRADLSLSACSLAVVKDGCILVVEDDQVHYSSDSGRTWSEPIETGAKAVLAAQLLNCDVFYAFSYDDNRFLRSSSGIGPPVVSVQTVVHMSGPNHGGVSATRWDELEHLLMSYDGSGVIVGYNSLGEVILGPTPITRTDGSLDGFSSRLRGQLIWLTVAAAKQSKTVVLLP